MCTHKSAPRRQRANGLYARHRSLQSTIARRLLKPAWLRLWHAIFRLQDFAALRMAPVRRQCFLQRRRKTYLWWLSLRLAVLVQSAVMVAQAGRRERCALPNPASRKLVDVCLDQRAYGMGVIHSMPSHYLKQRPPLGKQGKVRLYCLIGPYAMSEHMRGARDALAL
eukprot:4306-Heterococcus_DN1.PRE.3